MPARNEEACLAACLESLVAQRRVDFELLVMDDASTDRTAEIARSFPKVKVIPAPPLPPGWCGKQHALHTGAAHARGEWLLFTDADTVHEPGSLARALHEAKEFRAEMLSYSPRQETQFWWERAILPVIFSELACVYKPAEICDPASPAAAANGQYLLIAREAYDAIGGHQAVRATLLEDVALAQNLKRLGRRLRFRYGGDAARTRMYRSLPALVEGWTKNLALLFPGAQWLAARRMAEFAGIGGAAALAIVGARRRSYGAAAASGLVLAALYANFLRRIQRAHAGAASNALAIFGLPFFSLLLWRSAIYYASGRSIRWRGREYQFERIEQVPAGTRHEAQAAHN